jgi:hypothetical protein
MAVVPFKRKKSLNARTALRYLREIAEQHPDGVVEANSITHFGTLLGWTQPRTSKAVKAWKADGLITVDHADSGKLIVRIMPIRSDMERDGMPSQATVTPKTKRVGRHAGKHAETHAAEHAEGHAVGHAETHAAEHAEGHAAEHAEPAHANHAKSENMQMISKGKPLAVDPTGMQKMPAKKPAAGMPVGMDFGMGFGMGDGMNSGMPNGMPSAPENVHANHVTRHARSRGSWQLVLVAYGFFGLGIAINVWNARTTGGDLLGMAIPVGLGVLVEAVLFYVPARLMTLTSWRRALAICVYALFFAFAVVNSLRMASLIAADQAAARADRQTAGVQAAARALDNARAERDNACRSTQGKSTACLSRRDEVAKLEKAQTAATAKVEAAAKPENADFSALVTWITRGAMKPGANDFSMIWLLLRTILPQIGGLVLMLAKR